MWKFKLIPLASSSCSRKIGCSIINMLLRLRACFVEIGLSSSFKFSGRLTSLLITSSTRDMI
ncbi:hypothetical protein LINPERPRIM_LOCUS12659 [Linum perenne]